MSEKIFIPIAKETFHLNNNLFRETWKLTSDIIPKVLQHEEKILINALKRHGIENPTEDNFKKCYTFCKVGFPNEYDFIYDGVLLGSIVKHFGTSLVEISLSFYPNKSVFGDDFKEIYLRHLDFIHKQNEIPSVEQMIASWDVY